MDFHLPWPNVPLLVVAMGAMVLSAGAQPSGQSIIFSSPQNDDSQSAPPSSSDNSQPITLPSTLQAPTAVFDFNPPSDNLPLPIAPTDTPQQQRMKKLLEERKDWVLMTPEEILDSTPTENMLIPPEQDAFGREKDQTQLERYLEREGQMPESFTNGWQNAQTNSPWGFSQEQNAVNPLDVQRDNMSAAARNLNQLLNDQRNRDGSANQIENNDWDTLGQPLPQTTTKPNPEQLAAMERFRQLLAPSSAAPEISPDSRFLPVSRPAVDPFITQPDFTPNPAGASFTTLSSGIAKPSGLTPLPGAVTSFSQPLTSPAWKPQPPPWLLQGPQPFVMPQPKGF
jgi:hypothetical protein